ncbi:5-carboxymethyl-2-hydroxymuconateDelta-isomerase [Desulfofarcimen acetoxidans DSM 771]|uniref:5-carboxymethyl-2-hydroxymuconateDelta-isomerase n=1 Tax=Desulfofarcimen acetoxidans (strain ATCC 49208 / DSM 771 / KCTC 5769 / VKM B-1644 / 5575) TaxID=485916 RepID=C8VWE4_DESAS|nr:fumarylacetoacetate hydrolase family protein [Desulfofarcimen acetoxidans]ACV62496.1 5-carboxymethyl-2-hydroxymuconateDelta-isomerase [Desulfofarcimen acetoxidans DSM 771]
MLLGRFWNGREFVGIVQGDVVYPIHGTIFQAEFCSPDQYGFNLSELKVLAPCQPGKIICAGLNYRDHADEMGFTYPEEPVLFMKPPSSVIGPCENIIYPSMSKQVDYEAELAVVMKKTARRLKPQQVFEHILGYTCANDVTARDLQKRDGQWTRAKSFDTFAPIGPYVNTELDPANLDIKLYLNGQLKQNSNTGHFIFGIDKLVSFITQVMTLNPGDIIMTGTPSGIGAMLPGDSVRIEIQGIGTLENQVV